MQLYRLCYSFVFVLSLHFNSHITSAKSLGNPDTVENEVQCKTKWDYMRNTQCVHTMLESMGYASFDKLTEKPTDKDYGQAISDYQRFYGLKITGSVTEETADLLSRDGCGDPDVVPDHRTITVRRKKRSHRRGYWSVDTLTWCVKDYSLDLTSAEQDEALEWALQQWQQHSGLTFLRVDDCRSATIEVLWAKRLHGDFTAFDGPGGALAHTVLPDNTRAAGDVHFDDDETWSLSSFPVRRPQKLLKPIALHEFGHSLGFSHVPSYSSIMYRYYKNDPNPQLSHEDISRLQSIYGEPDAVEQEPHTLELCELLPDPDAIVMLGDGYIYAFTGKYFWRMNGDGAVGAHSSASRFSFWRMYGYAAMDSHLSRISHYWTDENNEGIEDNFDAALFWPSEPCTPTCNGDTYFFKGHQVWEQLNSHGTIGQMRLKNIYEIFPNLPLDIDAATITINYGFWNRESRREMLFLKGGTEKRTRLRGDDTAPYSISGSFDVFDRRAVLKREHVSSVLFLWNYHQEDNTVTYANCIFYYGGQYGCSTSSVMGTNMPYIEEPKPTVHWYGCNRTTTSTSTTRSTTPTTTTTTTPSPEPRSQLRIPISALCSDVPQPDAVTVMGDGYTYVFSGSYYWRMSLDGPKDEYLRRISETWFTEDGRGFVGNVEAAVFMPYDGCMSAPCTGSLLFFTKVNQDTKVFVSHNTRGDGSTLQEFYTAGLFPGLPPSVYAIALANSNSCYNCPYLYFVAASGFYTSNGLHRVSPYQPFDVIESTFNPWDNLGVWHSSDTLYYPWNEHQEGDSPFQFYYVLKDNEYIKYDVTNRRVMTRYRLADWYGCQYP